MPETVTLKIAVEGDAVPPAPGVYDTQIYLETETDTVLEVRYGGRIYGAGEFTQDGSLLIVHGVAGDYLSGGEVVEVVLEYSAPLPIPYAELLIFEITVLDQFIDSVEYLGRSFYPVRDDVSPQPGEFFFNSGFLKLFCHPNDVIGVTAKITVSNPGDYVNEIGIF